MQASNTIGATFDHVALLGEPSDIGLDPGAPDRGGNLVVLASDRPVDLAAVQKALDTRGTGWRISEGATLASWIGDAPRLTDDYAPVDQLLEPYSPR